MKIEKDLVKIIQTSLKIKKNIKVDNLGLGKHENWDSLFHLTLLLKIEKQFKIKIKMSEMSQIVTFKDLDKKIKEYKK